MNTYQGIWVSFFIRILSSKLLKAMNIYHVGATSWCQYERTNQLALLLLTTCKQ